MTDLEVDPAVSARMRAVRSKDTLPEMIVRRLAHGLGYRFRLHRKDLPGSPDLVFPGRRKVIFVHGCFWHHHTGCKRGTIPSRRPDYWRAKLERNVDRDARNVAELTKLGWQCMTIWECEMAPSKVSEATSRLRSFLG